MVQLHKDGVFLLNGVTAVENSDISVLEAKKGTIAYSILTAHNTSGNERI